MKNSMKEKATRLLRIQKRNNLNSVFAIETPHLVNKGYHAYKIVFGHEEKFDQSTYLHFQNGPRNEEGSTPGILDTDLLEIVRHRLKSFQEGPFRTRENEIVITKIEEALLWLNKRVEDRFEKNTLGTNKV